MKGGARRKKRKQGNKKDAMVFGDNVRARRAARALPRTPTQEEEEKRKGKENKTRRTRRDERQDPDTKTPPQTNNAVTANTISGARVKRRKENNRVLSPHTPPLIQHTPPLNHRPPHHFSRAHPTNNKDTNDRTGQHSNNRQGWSVMRPHSHIHATPRQHTPPFHCHATPPHDSTPPSTMPPPTTTVRGEQTKDTPPHEHHRQTHTPHTPHLLATNSNMT